MRSSASAFNLVSFRPLKGLEYGLFNCTIITSMLQESQQLHQNIFLPIFYKSILLFVTKLSKWFFSCFPIFHEVSLDERKEIIVLYPHTHTHIHILFCDIMT